MCTVSFCPSREGWLLTSSRDVKLSRPKASFPVERKVGGEGMILYPEDGLAKGTWIGTNAMGVSVCLLNGAFIKHEQANSYAKSRGQVVLDLLSCHDPLTYLKADVLEGIEPFTLVFIYKEYLIEYRWDGASLYKKNLDIHKRYLWSSVTLYKPSIISQRELLFGQWAYDAEITEKECMAYHRTAFEELGSHNRALMSRPKEDYGTVSITCIKNISNTKTMYYQDLLVHSNVKPQCANIPVLQSKAF